jgi:hypothetical protein
MANHVAFMSDKNAVRLWQIRDLLIGIFQLFMGDVKPATGKRDDCVAKLPYRTCLRLLVSPAPNGNP